MKILYYFLALICLCGCTKVLTYNTAITVNGIQYAAYEVNEPSDSLTAQLFAGVCHSPKLDSIPGQIFKENFGRRLVYLIHFKKGTAQSQMIEETAKANLYPASGAYLRSLTKQYKDALPRKQQLSVINCKETMIENSATIPIKQLWLDSNGCYHVESADLNNNFNDEMYYLFILRG